MKRILVIGASRGIGLECVKEALSRGCRVRAFARSAARIAPGNPNLERRTGDALNALDVASALDGVEAVILALGLVIGPAMLLGPVRLFSEATRILVPAMERAGVTRLVCVTGYGTGESRASIGALQNIGFNLVFGRAYADKDLQERLIRDSRLQWVIARPGVLTNGPKRQRYKIITEPSEWRNGMIARADVAEFMVNALTDDTYLGKAPVLVN